MTKKQICELFTKKVTEYIGKGYVISPESFSGSDGTSRVDLVNGNSFIRIYMTEEIEHTNASDYFSGKDILVIRVCEKKLNAREEKYIYIQNIVWTKDLEVLEETKFYIVNKYGRGNTYYSTVEEYATIAEKIAERRKRNYVNFGTTYINLPDSAKKVVLSFIRRQPKCKSVKVSDISRVEKCIYDDEVRYVISCKDRRYTLH